jgi:hypothetical protein
VKRLDFVHWLLVNADVSVLWISLKLMPWSKGDASLVILSGAAALLVAGHCDITSLTRGLAKF